MKHFWKRTIITLISIAFFAAGITVSAEEGGLSDLLGALKSAAQNAANNVPENTVPENTAPENTAAQASGESAFALAGGQSTYNILLIGADYHDSSWNGNSDCIILVSISHEKRAIRMMSFMRDLGVEVPGHGINKINYSHAVGGADLLIETLESNFEVRIDNYARADFMDLAELIDEIGGMTLELSDAEAEQVNRYTSDVCNKAGISAPEPICGGGTVHCEGVQVVAYARVRFVGNNDYERTERQRTILTNVFDQVKNLETSQMAGFAAKALAVVNHDLDLITIANLTTQLPDLLDYSIETARVPFDGHYYSDDEKLMPEQPYTNEMIRQILE